MFIVKSRQLKALERVPDAKSFSHQMADHIAEHFPTHANLLGREGLTGIVTLGIDKGKTYGFTTRYEVCLFIDTLIMLGSGCDSDIQVPFVSRSLRENAQRSTKEKIDILYKTTVHYLDVVVGPAEVFPVKALKAMKDFAVADFEARLTQPLRLSLAAELKQLWPEKYKVAGEPVILQLIDAGLHKANGYGFTTDTNRAYFVLWMYLLGHDFDKDPFYPWFGKVLNDPKLEEEDDRFSKLEFTFKAILTEAFKD